MHQDVVLVIDDDSAIVDALCMFLEIAGFNAQGHTGTDIVGCVKSVRPDLVLLDVWLSGTDGREICRAIKADATIGHIPVILISASRDLSAKAQQAGADDYIEKPFDMDEILTKVRKLLSSRSTQS